MATSASVDCRIAITKTLTTNVDNSNQPNVPLVVGGTTQLRSSTTPDVENGAAPRYALVAGALTVDLTALADVNGASTSATGKKVRAIIFVNRSATNNMTFAKGASNGFTGLAGTWSYETFPLQKMLCDLTATPEASIAAVDATHKTIDVTGIGTDGFDIALVWG